MLCNRLRGRSKFINQSIASVQIRQPVDFLSPNSSTSRFPRSKFIKQSVDSIPSVQIRQPVDSLGPNSSTSRFQMHQPVDWLGPNSSTSRFPRSKFVNQSIPSVQMHQPVDWLGPNSPTSRSIPCLRLVEILTFRVVQGNVAVVDNSCWQPRMVRRVDGTPWISV